MITFGTYEQDGNKKNGAEAIEWYVISDKNGKYILMSKYVLDAVRYGTEDSVATWQNSDVRSWLNGTFYKTAFNENERKYLSANVIENIANPVYGTDGGKDTSDKVYLLGMADIGKYLLLGKEDGAYQYALDTKLQAAPTKYAINNGVQYDKSTGNCYWWLRTPGSGEGRQTYVSIDGNINRFGNIASGNFGLRPVIVINVK